MARTGAALLAFMLAVPGFAQTVPERGVFVTQVGDAPRAEITQRNADSLARVAQDGANNQVDLEQDGSAPHRAQIAQDGDDNVALARQDGDGTADLVLAQEGNGNSATLQKREDSGMAQTAAAILQRGNGNSIVLMQDGSDNDALLNQVGDGLSDMQVVQTGNGNIQITQSNSGAAFAPPPAAPGG